MSVTENPQALAEFIPEEDESEIIYTPSLENEIFALDEKAHQRKAALQPKNAAEVIEYVGEEFHSLHQKRKSIH